MALVEIGCASQWSRELEVRISAPTRAKRDVEILKQWKRERRFLGIS
jgi:hypothetical protein